MRKQLLSLILLISATFAQSTDHKRWDLVLLSLNALSLFVRGETDKKQLKLYVTRLLLYNKFLVTKKKK